MLAEKRWEAGKDGAVAQGSSGPAGTSGRGGLLAVPARPAPRPAGRVIDGRRDRRQVPATSGWGASRSEASGGPGSLSPPFLSHPHCLTWSRAGDSQVGPRLGAGDRVGPPPTPHARRPGVTR